MKSTIAKISKNKALVLRLPQKFLNLALKVCTTTILDTFKYQHKNQLKSFMYKLFKVHAVRRL
jgi:hypothetical protein